MSGNREVTEAEVEAVLAQTFGTSGGVREAAQEPADMSVEEATDVLVGAAFGGESAGRVEEAGRVVTGGRTSAPANAAVFEAGEDAAMNDLLARVVTNPGGRTPGFSQEHDRRMDEAFAQLATLAESRMGMTGEQARLHARRQLLEAQYLASTAHETKDLFVQRLEQRVAGYKAMPSLSEGGR